MTTYQGELTSQEVVKLIAAETDEGGNILEELKDQDVRGIYEQLSPEDKKRFQQLRKFPPPVLRRVRRDPALLPYGQVGHEGSDAGATQCLRGRHCCQKSGAFGQGPIEGIVPKTWLQISRKGDEGRGAPRRRD